MGARELGQRAADFADGAAHGEPGPGAKWLANIKVISPHESQQGRVTYGHSAVAARRAQRFGNGADQGRHGVRIANGPQGEAQQPL